MKRTLLAVGLIAGLLPLLMVGTGAATIVGGNVTGGSAFTAGGTFVELSAPLANPFGAANTVGQDTFDSFNLFGFNEVQNFVLTAPLVVNVGSSPLPIGTTVSSHYIFFDPLRLETLIGTVNFSSTVIGLLTLQAELIGSNFLANPGVNYLYPTLVGLETRDLVTITGPNQISLAIGASTPGDFIRVLTADEPLAVPEPSAFLLLSLGVAGMVSFRMWRRTGKSGAESR